MTGRVVLEAEAGSSPELDGIPGIKFVDHVAIAVRPGELEGQVKAYESLGFRKPLLFPC